MLRNILFAMSAFALIAVVVPNEAAAGEPGRIVIHKPGTPAAKRLCVPNSAVPAHRAHGDRVRGRCLKHGKR